ncbi:MAG: DUF4421 domain-containing protein [Ferruginibacter sp.]
MNALKQLKYFLLGFGLLFFCCTSAWAQAKKKKELPPYNDSSYYVYFPRSVTGRIFFSQKYLDFTSIVKNQRDLKYKANTSSNLGIGFTWHNLSANFAYGFGIGKQKNESKGKTKYLDVQLHFFEPKWANDVYAQSYKGYHLSPKGFVAPAGSEYYYRPDMKVNLFGASRYRVFNSRRFSYRAAFIQNEWQKKSAGSFLLGGEAYYGMIKADSILFPRTSTEVGSQDLINKINYLSIGPGAGYAYTLVMFEHFFITGTLTANLNISYTTEHAAEKKANRFSFQPLTSFRVAAGYNSRRWSVSATWMDANLPFNGKAPENRYVMNTGNYRLIVARRFLPGKKLKKHLRKMEKEMKNATTI